LLNFARINKPESKYVREFRKLQQDKQKSQGQLDEEDENQSSSYSPKQQLRQQPTFVKGISSNYNGVSFTFLN
jgi:response regulator of citrate/malate metabolism